MNEILEKKYSYLSNFFETAIKTNRLFHSLIFYGSNNYIQYALAMELARQLNCLEEKKEDCLCRNCRWIRENKHPAVITISKIDNKSEKDTAKTVISAQQTEYVLDKIFASSDYYRVFIFCDANIKVPDLKEKSEYNEFKTTKFNEPQIFTDGKIWYPSSINKKCFQETSANSMLKSIEEPTNRVLFIFLTNTPNDLIATIVSRSQCFYVPDSVEREYETDFLIKYFEQYPKFDIKYAFDFVQTLLNYQNEKNCTSEYIIDCIQCYLAKLLKANSDNQILSNKIIKDLNKTQEAKNMLQAYVKEIQVYEHLAFYFAGKL